MIVNACTNNQKMFDCSGYNEKCIRNMNFVCICIRMKEKHETRTNENTNSANSDVNDF